MEARRIAFDSVEPTRYEVGQVAAVIAQAEAELNDTLTVNEGDAAKRLAASQAGAIVSRD